MLNNYLKIAFRNLVKNRLYSAVNIFGLAISLTSFILITLYVIGELNYDRFPPDYERTYRIIIETQDKGIQSAYLFADAAQILKSEFSEFEQVGRISDTGGRIVIDYENTRYNETRAFYAEPAIMEIFSYPMVAGNRETALMQPNSVVLTARTARKYFGETDPMGKTLILHDNNGEESELLTVTGVVEYAELQSHFEFDLLIAYATLGNVGIEQNFRGAGWTYVKVQESVSADALQAEMNRRIDSMELSQTMELMFQSSDLILQPLHEIHLYSGLRGEIQPNGDIRYVYIFSLVGLLILVVACVNYMNLSTARSLKRARETGVRKALGANRIQLAVQFFSESLLYILIAFSLAFLFVELSLSYFNKLMNLSIVMDYLQMVPLIIGIAIVTVVLASIYPSLYLSSFKPSAALQGVHGNSRQSTLWKGLTVFQFVISTGLVISALVISYQMEYIQNKNLGYQKKQLLTFEIDDRILREKTDLFLEELESQPGVMKATAMWGNPTDLRFSTPQTITVEGEEIEVSYLYVYHDFLETMGIDLYEGRDFLQERMGDAGRSILINKAFAERMGWEKSTGKQIPTFMGFQGDRTIIGVTDNFHFNVLYEEIGPAILQVVEPRMLQTVLVRLNMQNLEQTLGAMEQIWTVFQPNRPFTYRFVDEQFDSIYRQEQLLGKLIWFFTCISLVVACLGLLGLTTYYAELRTKEIGIRKVLGASVANILALFSKDFMKLVIMGFVIAIPIAWYAMHQWLADFAYRIEIGPGIFALAGMAALLIAMLTISWQSIKAAVVNPVESLRSE